MISNSDCKTACYSIHLKESLAIVDFTGDIYQLGACLDEKATFLTRLQALNDDPEIRGLLLLNTPGVLGDEKYCQFISNAIAARSGGSDPEVHEAAYSDCPVQLERLTNTLSQITEEVLKFSKLLIVAFEGDVAPPFFGAALAADYRFGTDEMVFQPSHLKLGIPPGGGLGFFLPRFVSHTKARDFLFFTEPTAAPELKHLGLLDDHFPCNNFREECTRIAGELVEMPLLSIMGVKAIIQPHQKDLNAFLNYEDKAMAGVMARRKFHKG